MEYHLTVACGWTINH